MSCSGSMAGAPIERTKDKKKKGNFFLVIPELCFFRVVDEHTADDAENPPEYEIYADKKDEESCADDRAGHNKETHDQ